MAILSRGCVDVECKYRARNFYKEGFSFFLILARSVSQSVAPASRAACGYVTLYIVSLRYTIPVDVALAHTYPPFGAPT